MKPIQHALHTLLAVKGDMDKFKEVIPYVLLPDAISNYADNRAAHFEIGDDEVTNSWMKYPEDLRNITEEKFSDSIDKDDVLSFGNNIEKLNNTSISNILNKYNGFFGIDDNMVQDAIMGEIKTENGGIENGMSMMDFLHGGCQDFALALSEKDNRFKTYNLQFEGDERGNIAVDKNGETHSLSGSMHHFCKANIDGINYYADVRGITADKDLFFSEYQDLIDDKINHGATMQEYETQINAYHLDTSKDATNDFFNKYPDIYDLDKAISKELEATKVNEFDVRQMKNALDNHTEIIADRGYQLSETAKTTCSLIPNEYDIDKFEEINTDLPNNYLIGVKMALEQDNTFNEYIKEAAVKNVDNLNITPIKDEKLNEINKNNVSFLETMDKASDDAIAVLANSIQKNYGITCDQEFIDENIYKQVSKVFPKDLSEQLFKQLELNTEVDKSLISGDWSKIPLNQTLDAETMRKALGEAQSACVELSQEITTKDEIDMIRE